MTLNHLNIKVPDVMQAREFYEKFLNFKFAFGHGTAIFLKDNAGFLLTLDQLNSGETADFPEWYHFGFCLKSAGEVKALYERMKTGGAEFYKEYKEYGQNAANFIVKSPGPYRMEITWNREDNT